MEYWSFFVVAYGMVALFALYMTHLEQRRQSQKSPTLSLVSYTLCVLWPLVVLAMMVVVRRRPAYFAPAEFD